MPALRTEVTEIVTGLAMLGFPTIDRALATRPNWLLHVGPAELERIVDARREGSFDIEFETAWENGVRFLHSPDGLRGRAPHRVEWKGHHKPPGYEQIPADLRVDHVYLISCKYGSSLLHNASPSHLFDRRLADRKVELADWYGDVAPEAYQELYAACRRHLSDDLPETVGSLDPVSRKKFKEAFKRSWPEEVAATYAAFAWAVAHASSERWRTSLKSPGHREEMLWRLLRLEASPYFVLGSTPNGEPLHYRTATPWDFRNRYRLRSFDIWPDAAGQPLVRWRSEVVEVETGRESITEGHVEIRWSHGRFAGNPEAKIYLDTPNHQVAGYQPLGSPHSGN
jgi:hypothetical protein